MSSSSRRLLTAWALLTCTCTGLAHAAPLEFGDPTRPTGVVLSHESTPDAEQSEGQVKRQGPRWQLTSTLLSGDRKVAVINGRSIRPGERIDGARLISVRHRRAVIEAAGRRITLKMPAASGDTLNAKKPSGR